MRKTYTLNVAGVTRELPLCPVNEKLDIAAFVMFSDVELTVACAEALLKKVPEFDIIVTAEAKGIPLAYEMSRQSGKRYIPARLQQLLHLLHRALRPWAGALPEAGDHPGRDPRPGGRGVQGHHPAGPERQIGRAHV